jgi:radical SAM protein with 4Fe4S-binding SPASM domain
MKDYQKETQTYSTFGDKLLRHCSVLNSIQKGKWKPITVQLSPTGKCDFNCKMCHTENTRILMSDLTWKSIQNIKIDEMCMGLDADSKWVKTTIKNTFGRTAPCIELKTVDGLTTCSLDHKWREAGGRWRKAINIGYLSEVTSPKYIGLVLDTKKYQKGWLQGMIRGDGCIYEKEYMQGCNTDTISRYQKFRLAVRDEGIINRFCQYLPEIEFRRGTIERKSEKHSNLFAIWSESKSKLDNIKKYLDFEDHLSFRAGFLGGMFDAEGSYSCNTLRISNENKEIIEKISDCLSSLGFEYVIEKHGVRVRGGASEAIRFFATCRPVLERKIENILGHRVASKRKPVVSKREIGIQKVYNIETEAGNYIANGFISKNCSVKNRDKNLELDFKVIKKGLKDFRKLGAKALEITGGGNPLLYPQINELINYAFKLGYKIGIISNSINPSKYLTKKSVDQIIWFRSSLSGFYKSSKVPYDFSIIPEGKLGFSYIITDETTKEHLEAIVELVKQRPDVKFVRIAANCLDGDEIKNFKKKWGKVIESLGEKFFIKEIGENYRPYSDFCGVGMIRPYCTEDGNIYPCSSYVLKEQKYDPAYSIGRLENVRGMYNEANILYETFQKPYMIDPKKCYHCFYANNNKLLHTITKRIQDEDFA